MLFSDINQAFNLHDNVKTEPVNMNEIKKKIIHNPNFEETFYNAYGGMQLNEFNTDNINNYYDKNLCGTKINDIQPHNHNPQTSNHQINYSDSLSFIDNKKTLQHNNKSLYETRNKYQKKHSCGYYINKFIETIIYADNASITSTTSITSSEDIKHASKFDDIYDHVKKCSFCRSHINIKMKKMYKQDPIPIMNKYEEPNQIVHSIKNQIKDFDLKEIIIIIIVGIIIIFILDMFVKIGRKSN